jgi:hypothetical protein
MLADADDETRQAGARLLTLAAYYDANLDSAVDVLLSSADVASRAAAVGDFADSITYAPRRDRTIAVLSAAFHDPDKGVRDAAKQGFYRLTDEPLADYAPLISAFADSPAPAGDAMCVVRLTLRVHAQHTHPDVRRRCLDLIDRLIVLGTHNIEADLDTVER